LFVIFLSFWADFELDKPELGGGMGERHMYGNTFATDYTLKK
jgi:hypothetical protein